MQWVSVSATDSVIETAIGNAAGKLLSRLGREPDLVIVFIATEHRPHFTSAPALLRNHFTTATTVGCLCQNSIGEGREHDDESNVTLLGAVLPDVQLHVAHLDDQQQPPLYAERTQWNSALNITDEPQCMVVLGAPFTFDIEALLKGLDRHYPMTAIMGGLASGADQPDVPCLLMNGQAYASGAITLSMSGNIAADTLVAQGCRPIGDPMFANSTHENLLLELDGKVPRDVLTELFGTLNKTDRHLFTHALFLGIAMETQRERYQSGDFLIRAILGLDPQSGALWINSPVPERGVVQLHVRDAQASAADLEALLTRYRASPNSMQAQGALLMSCTGRGANLYDKPNHDSNAFRKALGDIPLGGCFCNGEIGPVRGTTYLHSFTSVFGVFREKQARDTH
ncbi:MAG: FIST N-terminal domain-containing protein [Steroidobacter sp.]